VITTCTNHCQKISSGIAILVCFVLLFMLSPAHLGHDVSVAVYGALSYPDFALSLLQCRSLIYAGDN
jgi:hypothetical protein